MSTPVTPKQRGSRSPKSRGARKRSTSSPFASLFATLTSFSSSGNAESPSASTPTAPESAAASSDVSHKSRRHLRRRTESRSDMPPSRGSDSKIQLKRQSTPQKQIVKHSQSVSNSPSSSVRPNVFTFMSGEISTPPTPRPHAGPNRGLGITSDRTIERAAALNHVSAPIPRRPLRIPQSASSLSSDSDSDEAPSTVASSPDTPTPDNTKALATSAAARRSLERITGKDAVGRSIRSEDYYPKIGRNRPTAPPEAPMPPHLMLRQHQQRQQQQQQQQQQQGQQLPMQHSSGFNHEQPVQSLSLQTSLGEFGEPETFSSPYPTPPLEQPLIPSLSSKSAPTIGELSDDISVSRIPGGHQDVGETIPEYLPRQYRILTLSTIKRTEMMIDGLEAELRSLDKAIPPWHREQLTMRLTNTLVMHHRLVDTWSKVSQLSPLTMSKTEDRQKIEAVWAQLRQQYSHRAHINGLGVDKFISNVVNDLVHVGENAQTNNIEGTAGFLARTQDMRMIIMLLGLILTLLLLKDETFQKIIIGVGVVLGLYTITGAQAQDSALKKGANGRELDHTAARKNALARSVA